MSNQGRLRTSIIVVPLFNFWTVQVNNILQPVKMMHTVSNMLFSGMLSQEQSDVHETRDEDGVLISSVLLKHYTAAPCLDYTQWFKKNHTELWKELGEPSLVSMRGIAVELDYTGNQEPGLDYLNDRPLVKLCSVLSNQVLGNELPAETPIILNMKVIACSDTGSASTLAGNLGLAKFSDDLYIGLLNQQTHVNTNVLSPYIGQFQTYPILSTPHLGLRYPARDAFEYALVLPLLTAELYCLKSLANDTICQLVFSSMDMPGLVKKYLYKDSRLIKHWLFLNDNAPTTLLDDLSKLAQTIGRSPEAFRRTEKALFTTYSSTQFERLNYVNALLKQFAKDFIGSIGDRPLPVLADLQELSKNPPDITQDLCNLSDGVREFRSGLEANIDRLISFSEIRAVLRGVLVAIGALVVTAIISVLLAVFI